MITCLIVLVFGIVIGLIWAQWPLMYWENQLDWVAVLGFLGAVLNALVIWVVSVSITTKLEERAVGRRFEKELVGGFRKATLGIVDKIHGFFHDCVERSTFSDADRHRMVSLFSELGHEILMIEEAMSMCSLAGGGLDITPVQIQRGEYKDLLTDHAIGTGFSPDDEKSEALKYRAIRKAILSLMVWTNRAA